MRLQQAGVRADGMHMHPVQGLGGGDQRIGHGAGRKVDDQVVDGIARAALDDIQGQNVCAHGAERNGDRPQTSGTVSEL